MATTSKLVFLLATSTILSLYIQQCESLITKNNPDRLLLETFDIELKSVSVKSRSESSMTISVQFSSTSDVTIVWFVDRDMPVIRGDKNFLLFETKLKPLYSAELISTLDHETLKTKDIRLQLTANGKSLYIDINTANIHKVPHQTFSRMKYRRIIEHSNGALRMPTPLFDIESNVQADTLYFYPVNRRIPSYGGGGLLSYSRINLSDKSMGVTTSTVLEDPNEEVFLTYLQVGYSGGLVSNLVLGIQYNPSNSPTPLPQGKFELLRGNIYYRDLKTGKEVEGKLYRCSAVGNVQLQLLIDNEGTYTNGTDLPYIYVDNGFEKDLYVVRRPKESCTPAIFCQAFYRYKQSKKLSWTKHQLPPRYRPWYHIVDEASKEAKMSV